MQTLNAAFIRNQRTKNQISLTRAADLLGTGRPVLQRVESGDDAAIRLITVGGLLRLADECGCRASDFFYDEAEPVRGTTPHVSEPRLNTVEGENPSNEPEPERLAPILAGYLLAAKKQTSVARIAEALGWDRTQVHSAKQVLSDLLQPTGIRLAVRADMLQLVPAELPIVDEAIEVTAKAEIDRRGINDGVARILNQVLVGATGPSGNRSVFTRNALATLTALGALARDAESPRPSDALLFALDQGRTESLMGHQ